MQKIEVNILWFGNLAAKTGVQKEKMVVDAQLDELRKNLEQKHSFLVDLPYLIAVNQELIRDNCELKPGDEIAIMPPFAGG